MPRAAIAHPVHETFVAHGISRSNTMIPIRDIDHIVLRVVDLDRMLRFYCDVLGCTVERSECQQPQSKRFVSLCERATPPAQQPVIAGERGEASRSPQPWSD